MGYYEGNISDLSTGCNNNGLFGNGWEGLIGLALVAGLFGGWGNGGFGFGGNRGFGYGAGIGENYVLATDFATIERKLDGVNNGLCDGFYAQNTNMLNGFSNLQQTLCQGFSGVNSTIVNNGYETRNAITNGFNNVNNAICTLGYQNQAGFNALSREFADCCCKTQRAIDGVNYNMATQFSGLNNTLCNLGRDIIENQNANYRAIHEELVASKLEAKNDRIAELQDKLYKADLRASQAQQSNYITDTIINKLSPCPSPSYIVPNPNCCYNYGVYPTNNGCCASVV